MGGILLICALVAIYLVAYWSIHIELNGDKTTGFLALIKEASTTLHDKKFKMKNFLSKTSLRPHENIPKPLNTPPPLNTKNFSQTKNFLRDKIKDTVNIEMLNDIPTPMTQDEKPFSRKSMIKKDYQKK